MMEAIRRIRTKLDEARRRGLTCFGSDSHRFRLNGPLSEARLQAFERQHGGRLPEDYRLFLREAGNGGAGPYHGLVPLERWGDAVPETQPNYLALPSPLRPGMPENVAWEQALNCSWEELFQGTLVHQGCSYYALLVVAGPYRGRVVYVNLDCCGTPYFVRDPDFLSWYERWLDELRWGYDGSWFGFGLPGREADMVVALRQPSGDADLRREALATLARIQVPSQETLAVVRTALGDGSAAVRRQAVFLLGKHGVREAAADIADLRHDADASVRQAALDALARLGTAIWEPAARAALRDGDPDVVFRALCLLRDAGRLRKPDLEEMLRSMNGTVRAHALWAAETVAERDDPVAIPDDLLRDPAREVRRLAIRAAGNRKDRTKVPALLDLLRQETDEEILSHLVSALGNIGDREAVPALIEMTRHPDGFVRLDTARALGNLGDGRAIPALEKLLADRSKPVWTSEQGLCKVLSSRSGGGRGPGSAQPARDALVPASPARLALLTSDGGLAMAKRATRAQIAQETVRILGQGDYLSPTGQQVSIGEALADARTRSVWYAPDQFAEVFSRRDELLRDREAQPGITFEVVNETTLHAARRLIGEKAGQSVLALNFASARHPGGGFLKGSQAQEESLARASGLYACLTRFPGMYEANSRFPSCLYTDHMICSPDVPVFRDDDDRLLEQPCRVSFVTAPAVNAGAVRRNEPHNIGQIEPTMLARIEKMLALAVVHGHETLVLGAWGCGVFANIPADVARWFAQHLTGAGTYRAAFRKVVFAVLDSSPNQASLRSFEVVFSER